jgi:hypothetical protein
LVPANLAWESLFKEVATGAISPRGIGIFADEDKLRNSARRAVERAAASRAAPEGVYSHGREAAAAADVLNVRDDLMRDALQETVDVLTAVIRGRSQLSTIDLGVEGRTVNTEHGIKCSLTVFGREHPHLIPEFDYWQSYFSLYAHGSDQKDAAGRYKADFLSALRQGRLKLPRERQEIVLRVAERTTLAVKAAAQSGASSDDIAQIVLRARTSLLRVLTPSEWTEVRNDAARTRAGSWILYPVN